MAELVAGIESPIAFLAELLGASQPALRLLFTILLGYPLALVHRYLLFGKSITVQHLFFITSGLSLGIFNYGSDIFHSVLCVLITYCILLTFGGTFKSVIVSFFFLMGYLIYGYYITGTNDYDIKWSMPQCVLTLRLIGLAWDVYDGQKPFEKLSNDQKKTALKTCPSLLEVAGHTYFFGGFMVGPQFPMKRYVDFIEGSFPGKDISGKPSCIGAGLKRLGQGILILSLYQIGNMFIPEKALLSAEFMDFPLFKKLFLIGLWGKIALYKYVACWLISEGSCIMTGMTYNGTDENGNHCWDGCANVKLWDFNLTTTFEGIIKSFNINTNLWVGQYVFKRLKFLGNRYISQAAALGFLAIWHGLHSGYYSCFLSEFIVMYFEKDVESILNNRLPKVKAMLSHSALRIPVLIFLKVYVDIFMGYCLVSFVLLSWSRYMQVYGSVYYIGHILYFGWPFVSPVIKLLIPKAKVRDEKAKTQ
ncbi:lysophospholipid acyltransferase 5 [Trichonephila inaurata madagascariensis]|uniref:Lysophospholipid acyltransferase 5 n=1 Tax=Trichonephila inaurata madagascariensis TaxID=2747483 RepID=A0A8X6X2U5_9ARAC|nr:lysophospholipid acyltransferase 5 [Trichonephila inaurata madagascariensis]